MDLANVPRRLRAARVLADLTVEQLADRLDTPGLGAKTLGSIERGERTIRPHELRAIAEALDAPRDFFTARTPFSTGMSGEEAVSGEQVATLRAQLIEFREWAENAVERLADVRTEAYGRLLGRLDEFETRFTRIEETRHRGIESVNAMQREQARLADLVAARLDDIDAILEPIVDLAVLRTAADVAEAADSQERAAAERAADDRGRRRQGQGSRRQSS